MSWPTLLLHLLTDTVKFQFLCVNFMVFLPSGRFIFVPFTHFELQHLLLEQCRVMGYHCPAYFFTWLHLQEISTAFQAKQVGDSDFYLIVFHYFDKSDFESCSFCLPVYHSFYPSFHIPQVSKRPAVKQIRRQNSQTILSAFGIKQVGRPHSAVCV